jgi:prolyl-tRNA editing enzyme YbaK/EbsC (Cys-tRNA(Pro) deacylase)
MKKRTRAEQFEARHALVAKVDSLIKAGHSVGQAAKQLGVNRTHVYRCMRLQGALLPRERGPRKALKPVASGRRKAQYAAKRALGQAALDLLDSGYTVAHIATQLKVPLDRVYKALVLIGEPMSRARVTKPAPKKDPLLD